MLNQIQEAIQALFGVGGSAFELAAWQMAARAFWVYLFAILLVRVGNKRFIGRNTAFDLLIAIMLGSVLSRGITGQAPLPGCMAAGVVLLLMHWVLGAIAFHLKGFGPLIKGRPRILIRDGAVDEKAMAKSHLGKEDLAEALRREGHSEDTADIRLACLERNGQVSILTRKEPAILEVKVEEGVQTVRIAIDH